jgi:choline kinase
MDGILPAAGSASRMRGIPKFLLPCSDQYQTLIERHLENLLKYCETVWIPTRPELVNLLQSLGLSSDRVVIVSLSTQSMTETVLKIARISSADNFILCMPDTYFHGELPYEELANIDSDLRLACWKIRKEQMGKLGQIEFADSKIANGKILNSRDKDANCEFEHSWGALSFNRKFIELGKPEMPHVGYIINPAINAGLDIQGFTLKGQYFDCGTPMEYLQLIEKVLHE